MKFIWQNCWLQWPWVTLSDTTKNIIISICVTSPNVAKSSTAVTVSCCCRWVYFNNGNTTLINVALYEISLYLSSIYSLTKDSKVGQDLDKWWNTFHVLPSEDNILIILWCLTKVEKLFCDQPSNFFGLFISDEKSFKTLAPGGERNIEPSQCPTSSGEIWEPKNKKPLLKGKDSRRSTVLSLSLHQGFLAKTIKIKFQNLLTNTKNWTWLSMTFLT